MLFEVSVISTHQTLQVFSAFFEVTSLSCTAGLAAVRCLSLHGCRWIPHSSCSPWLPQGGCLHAMAPGHCPAYRTFPVCLWRSTTQVLTCNTTAVQFVSRGEAVSCLAPSGGTAAPGLAPARPCIRAVRNQLCRASFAGEKSQK